MQWTGRSFEPSRSRSVFLCWLPLLWLSVSGLPLAAQGMVTTQDSDNWKIKYETLQTAVQRIVPLLEAELLTAQSELRISRQARQKAEQLLTTLQSESTASANEWQSEIASLKDTIATLTMQVDSLMKQIGELLQRLSEVSDSWRNSEASRQSLETAAEAALRQAVAETQARQRAENTSTIIGVAAGVGGVLLGVLGYAGIQSISGGGR